MCDQSHLPSTRILLVQFSKKKPTCGIRPFLISHQIPFPTLIPLACHQQEPCQVDLARTPSLLPMFPLSNSLSSGPHRVPWPWIPTWPCWIHIWAQSLFPPAKPHFYTPSFVFNVLVALCGMRDLGSPSRGWTLPRWPWKPRVLTTILPGKSLYSPSWMKSSLPSLTSVMKNFSPTSTEFILERGQCLEIR